MGEAGWEPTLIALNNMIEDAILVWKRNIVEHAKALLKLTTDDYIKKDRAIKKILRHINAPDFNIHLALLIHTLNDSIEAESKINPRD